MDNTIRPYFSQNMEMYIHKNMVLEIDDYEFYIKYSRPFFGKISPNTEIKIESSTPKPINVLRIAPIWEKE